MINLNDIFDKDIEKDNLLVIIDYKNKKLNFFKRDDFIKKIVKNLSFTDKKKKLNIQQFLNF